MGIGGKSMIRFSKLKDILSTHPAYRFAQAEHAVFKELIEDWQQATSLPLQLREQLNRQLPLTIHARNITMPHTTKALIKLHQGYTVETVLLAHAKRNTVCVSSQVGCPLACRFCHSGKLAFQRNLHADEIITQVLYFQRILKKTGDRVNNVVFMGMGEPFLNYHHVITALKMLNHENKLGISARKISISTAGIAHKIKEFSREGMQVNLAVSLNAPTDSLRSQIMPVNKKYPLKDLIGAVRYYIDQTNRKVMFEYVLIDRLNDQPVHAQKLSVLLKDMLCLVNLIPYNGNGALNPPSHKALNRFKKILDQAGTQYIQRQRLGKEIDAACGELLYRTHALDASGETQAG